MNQELTVQQAYDSVQSALNSYKDNQPIDPMTLKNIHDSIGYLNLRDYLIGLPDEGLSVADSIGFITILQDTAENKVPYQTIISAYTFEAGFREKAIELLPTNKEYPLATLLKRVYEADWPTYAFANMRQMLHPKVITEIEREKDRPIKELINE